MCKKDKAVTKRERKKKTTTAVNIRRGLTSSWPFFLVNVRETVGTNGRTKREGKIKIKERGWRTYAGPTFLFHGAFRCWTNEWTQKKKEPPPPLRTPLVGNEITAPEIVLKSSLVSARAEKVKVITAKKGRKKGGKKKVPLLTDIIHGLKEILWKKNLKAFTPSSYFTRLSIPNNFGLLSWWGWLFSFSFFLTRFFFRLQVTYPRCKPFSRLRDLLVIIFYLENHSARLRCFLMTGFSLHAVDQSSTGSGNGPTTRRKDRQGK